MKDGEEICNKCDGKRALETTDPEILRQCPKCRGRGIVDWIENIMGRKGTYIKRGVYTKEVDISSFIGE